MEGYSWLVSTLLILLWKDHSIFCFLQRATQLYTLLKIPQSQNIIHPEHPEAASMQYSPEDATSWNFSTLACVLWTVCSLKGVSDSNLPTNNSDICHGHCWSNTSPPSLELDCLQTGRFFDNSATKRSPWLFWGHHVWCSTIVLKHQCIAMQHIVFSRNRMSKNVPEWKTEYWISFCAWTNT